MKYIENINKIMEIKEITPAELAREINKDKSNITKILKEEGRYLSIEELIKICKYLDVSADYILGLSNNKNSLKDLEKYNQILKNEKIINISNNADGEINIETEKSYINKSKKTYLSTINTYMKKESECKDINELENYINDILIEYEKDDNYEKLKELLKETFEDKLKLEIEEYLYIILGTHLNNNSTIFDILKKEIIKKYKVW